MKKNNSENKIACFKITITEMKCEINIHIAILFRFYTDYK